MSTYDRDGGACSASDYCEYIDAVYNEIVFVLGNAADMYVPVRRKNFYTFWWDEELNLLKEASVDANKLLTAAGKPRRFTIRARQVGEDIVSYFATNRCRKLSHTPTIYMMAYSRRMVMSFGSAGAPNLNNVRNVQTTEVEGCVNSNITAKKFAHHCPSLQVFPVMLDVFREMLHVFPVMLHVFPVMLQETRATLQETRENVPVCKREEGKISTIQCWDTSCIKQAQLSQRPRDALCH